MKTFLCSLSILLLLGSCTKPSDKDPEITVCVNPGDIGWIKDKKKDYADCRCLTEFRTGIYNNQQVFEIRIIDPLCNGIPMLFKADGTAFFTTMTEQDFQHYLDNVKGSQVFWSCNKGSTP